MALTDNYPDVGQAALAQTMLARRDAPPAAGTFPVVVYAPGSSASAHDNADLCEYLASHGYLVIASASIGLMNEMRYTALSIKAYQKVLEFWPDLGKAK